MSDLLAAGSADSAPAPGERGQVPGAPVVYEKLVLASGAVTTALLVAAAVTVSVHRDELASGVGDAVQPAAAGTANTLMGCAFIATVAAFFGSSQTRV